jgi:2,3-bisphosphoglycerate-dependent phosphoglycerate mutase
MSKLLLVRHGQSEWNQANLFTGWVDVDLTDQGINEAKQGARAIKEQGLRFHKAFTSELTRAQRTLDIILQELGQTDLEIVRDKALNERHYGDLQGKNKAEMREQFGDEQVHVWRRSYEVAPPNGESLKDTAARAIPYFEQNIVTCLEAGQDIIVSAHGNSLRGIVMKLDNMSGEEVAGLEIPTGKPLLYEYDNGSFRRVGYLESGASKV